MQNQISTYNCIHSFFWSFTYEWFVLFWFGIYFLSLLL